MLKLFGQLWGMQSTLSDHSLKLQLPGRSTVTCAFSARQPNHARAAFCLNTPWRIPSLRVVNCCKISSTGKSSQSILSLPMSVGRFFSASIAPRWKCSSLLLTASLLWEINLSVSEAPAGASNHKLCFLRYVTSRARSSRNTIGDQWAGNQTLRKSTGQSAPNQSVIVVCWSPWITASPGLALTWEAILTRLRSLKFSRGRQVACSFGDEKRVSYVDILFGCVCKRQLF